MTNIFKDSRRDLRERAFQTLFALEFGGEALEQAHFAYTYDKPIDEEIEVDVPAFLLSLVTGVREELAQLDSQIEEKLKEGWSLSRLIVTDRTLLRLGLYEITSFEETPGRVAINEIIEIAKKYSDETSAKFINGVLSQFVIDEAYVKEVERCFNFFFSTNVTRKKSQAEISCDFHLYTATSNQTHWKYIITINCFAFNFLEKNFDTKLSNFIQRLLDSC